MSRTDESWTAAEETELARLNAQLAELAANANEAQSFLAQLAGALFPDGPPHLGQMTWPEETPKAFVDTAHPGTGAEDKLRAAEIRYRTLVEQIPAVTFMAVLGEGQNEIYVSPHIEALLGFTQREWLENPFLWYSQLHPADRSIWNDEFARGCRTGGPFQAECRFIARDGRVVWVRGEARVVRDEIGRPLFLQGVAFDITESKRAGSILLRQAVRTTEERYRALVEGIGAVVWEAAPQPFAFTFVSGRAEQLFGFAPERWQEASFWPAQVHPDDLDELDGVWRTAIARGDEHTAEYRVIAADGRVVWVHDNLRVLRDAEGRAEHVLGVMLDVTARKQAEQERADLLAREREARAESETLARVERTLAAELDYQRLVQTVIDAGTALCGATFGAFFYRTRSASGESYMLSTVSGAPREAFETFPQNTPLFDVAFPGIVRCDDVTQDPRYTMAPHHGPPAGHLPVRSYLAVPVTSRSGEVLGALFFGHPEPGRFTERHERMLAGLAAQAAVTMDNARLYEAAEHARRAAEDANRAKDEFLATMSHELRTPLNAVLGWTRMLRGSYLDAAARMRALETIERNGRALVQLVEDVLDVSRIVTGKMQLNVHSVDIAEVVVAAHEVVALAAEAKGITVEVSLDPRGGTVRGDQQRLQQVLWNLLSNAIKFTPPGGHVAVRLESDGSLARIVVADTGGGISQDFLPYVFDRFRQADSSSSRAHGGLGLGLAIVRHIVELHGGQVRAESPGPGGGATFIVEIPVERAAAPPAPPVDGVAAQAVRPLHGADLLLVEDEPDTRELVKLLLEQAGATVVAADSVAAALDALSTTRPSAVITDIGMPGDDGYVLLRKLREGGIGAPVIALTAYGGDDDRHRAAAAGFVLHLTKPIEPGVLIDAIGAVVNDAREKTRPPSIPADAQRRP